MLDALRPEHVRWNPWDNHRRFRPYHPIVLYKGFFPWDDIVVSYMPDRCLWQFGYIQDIAIPPIVEREGRQAMMMRWLYYTG